MIMKLVCGGMSKDRHGRYAKIKYFSFLLYKHFWNKMAVSSGLAKANFKANICVHTHLA